MKRFIVWFFFGSNVLPVFSQTGPGGVGNTASTIFWFSGDGGAYTDAGITPATQGQQVMQWNDRSGNANHASQATAANRPLFQANSANGKPGLRFTGNMFIDGPNPGIPANSSYTYLLAFRDTSTVTGGTNDGNGTFILDRTTATNNLVSLKPVSGNRYFFQKRNNAGGGLGGPSSTTAINTNTKIVEMRRNYNTNYQFFYNGTLEATLGDGDGPTTPPSPRIGRHATTANNGIRGYINEFVVYNFALNTAQTIIVNNYLAAKYGLTPGNNVYTMDDPANGNYDHEVAGIGRVDAANLHTDAQGSSFVRINTPSGLGNNEFLMWGHDNGDISSNNISDVDGAIIESRLNRIWRISETGNVGTVTVIFDFSSFSPLSGTDLRLLIDRDGDGFSDNDVAPVTGVVSGTTVSFALTNFQNGDRFTLGSVNVLQSPLPVELLYFTATKTGQHVRLDWETASEVNNDYFTPQRSQDGLNWMDLGQVNGAGNSNQHNTYFLNDTDPIFGLQYYRLRQTDFDGSQTFSGIVAIDFSAEEDSFSFVLFPNPADDHFEIQTNSNSGTTTVRMFTINGQLCMEKQFAEGETKLIDVSHLNSGTYFIELKQGTQTHRRSFVRK